MHASGRWLLDWARRVQTAVQEIRSLQTGQVKINRKIRKMFSFRFRDKNFRQEVYEQYFKDRGAFRATGLVCNFIILKYSSNKFIFRAMKSVNLKGTLT